MAKRYFWIFIWHSSRDTRQLRGWLRLNSMFNNPGYKYLFFKWRIVKSKLKYKIQISPKPTSVILKHTYTHTQLNNKQLKFVTFHSNYPCRKRHLHIYLTTMCPCLSSTSTGVCFQHLSILDINVISFHDRLWSKFQRLQVKVFLF